MYRQIFISNCHKWNRFKFVLCTTFWSYPILSKFWVKCRMLGTLHVSPWIVVNISESLLCSQYLFKTSLRENTTRKLPSISYDILLKNCAIQCCFPYSPCYLIISPYSLQVGFLLQYMSRFHSRQLVKYFRNIVNWCRVAISNDKSWLFSLFCCFLSIFVRLNVTCRLCVIFVREDTYSASAFTASPNGKGYIGIDTVRERRINVITHSLTIYSPWLLL